jgi:hypothetical protein
MSYIVPLVGAAVVAAIGVSWWTRLRALARERERVVVAAPRPTVRILADDELREAVGRASRFDDDLWRQLSERADRYQALAPGGAGALLPLPPGTAGPGRSAGSGTS